MNVETESNEKHDIWSYRSPTQTMSSSMEEERPALVPSLVRSQDHLHITPTETVEGKQAKSNIKLEHIVKIFTRDNSFIEVSPEQVERVKMMHERFESGVYFSFNYNTLLLVAAVVAGLGLASNSSSAVIASMLVSPIMGPVVGLAYGTTINDWKLVRLSVQNEGISLLFCLIIGVVIGAITGVTALGDSWMTDEMASRASLTNFLVACPVAFFSGMGVAVSLLDEQTSSLVGVAISASLLPPAVNCGLVWMYYAYIKAGYINVPPPPESVDEIMEQGLLSLFLTLANIVLIWLASMLMFRMKEVLPIEKKVFWSDLGVARKIYHKRALLQVVETDVVQDIEKGAVSE